MSEAQASRESDESEAHVLQHGVDQTIAGLDAALERYDSALAAAAARPRRASIGDSAQGWCVALEATLAALERQALLAARDRQSHD